MKSECLPFSQIPHTTRLFADFLSDYSKVRQFYPRSPYFNEWLKEEASAIRYDSGRRERVSAILERQNQSLGASAETMKNIGRLRAGAAAVVTGQQVGLFGGPMFSVYKALTAVKLADVATQSGVASVPIFWLATEDHDLAEVNQVSMPGPDGSLHRLVAPIPAADAPVGTVTFGAEIESLLKAAAGLMGDSPIVSTLRESYRPGETFGSAFARLFAKLFADRGVILLDASDPELHQIATPIYQAAVERAAELDDALIARGKALEAAGYHQQVKVTPSSTLLFALQNGVRVPVHRRTNGRRGSDEFFIPEDRFSQPELLNQIASAPQRFSANVLLRPVVQDYLLPTLAYTGGSAEVAYFAQAAVVYQALLGKVTPVIPRFSATIVEAKPQSLLDRYHLSVTDLFAGPEALREQLAARNLPSELQSAFDVAHTSLEKSLAAICRGLSHLDKTLLDSANNAGSKIRYQLDSLRARAARAELRQTEILGRHAELLSNSLYPNKALQEREIVGVSFLSRYGTDLLRTLYDAVHTDCLDHQVISL